MSAERGWLGEPPPQQRDHEPPSHAYKWYKMMGAAKAAARRVQGGRE